MNAPTRTQLLVETRLGSSLTKYVARHRKAGHSWEVIARNLHADTDIPVTSQSLRNWYGEKHPGRVPRRRSDESSAA